MTPIVAFFVGLGIGYIAASWCRDRALRRQLDEIRAEQSTLRTEFAKMLLEVQSMYPKTKR